MRPILFLPLSLIWLLPGCEKKADPAAAPQSMPPAAVTFVTAARETVQVTRDLPGRLEAVRVAEVRARVPGILLKKEFKEGADVKAGDVLFQIDPAPLKAAKSSAEAGFNHAEAAWKLSQNQVERLRVLVKVNAISKQEADNAESAVTMAEAQMLEAKAALSTAELNLGYATVTAPIDGRIGKAIATEGALVGQGSPTLLAVIQQLEPVYFDFTQSSSEVFALRKSMANADPARAAVKLLLDDGSEYGQPGKLLFSEASVDESTGMVTLRAEFPNKDRELLPGMFARARIVQSVQENVITVPQRTLIRTAAGGGSVMVINDANIVQPRPVQTGEAVGDKWIITSGLSEGERVLVEGGQKAKPGSQVKPEPFQSNKTAAAPTPERH